MIKIYKSSIKNDNIICGIWNNSDVPIFISNTNKQLEIPNGNGKLYPREILEKYPKTWQEKFGEAKYLSYI